MPVRLKCVYLWFHCAGGVRGRIVLCPMILGSAQSVVLDADCLGQVCQGSMHSPILSIVLDALPQMQLDRVVGMNDRTMNGSVWPTSRSSAVK